MKAYICDRCKKHAEPDQYDLEPRGWIRLSARNENRQVHLCSPTCLLTEAEARFNAAADQAPVADTPALVTQERI